MWAKLNMDVAHSDKARQMLSEVYGKMFLSLPKRPQGMAYFDDTIREIFGGRVLVPELPDITGALGAALHGTGG